MVRSQQNDALHLLETKIQSLLINNLKINAEILSVDSTYKIVPDKTPGDNFDDTFSVREAWHLLKCNSEIFTSQLHIRDKNSEIILNTDSIVDYCLKRKKEKSYKHLYKVISKERSLSDTLYFETIWNHFPEDKKYIPDNMEYIAEHFLNQGQALVIDENGHVQQTYFLTTYETDFSAGVNFHFNNVDSTLFFHVTHIMR